MKTVGETACKIMYNGWSLIREDLGAATPSSRFYVWGLDLSGSLQGAGGVGGLLAMLTPDSCLLTPAYDANGNISEYVDGGGSIVAHYEYDAFGNEISRSGAEAQSHPFRFSTKYTDDESGLVYYGYRFYNPGLGRWVNRDPIGELGGLNVYGFVGNASVVDYDTLGLWGGIWPGLPPGGRYPPGFNPMPNPLPPDQPPPQPEPPDDGGGKVCCKDGGEKIPYWQKHGYASSWDCVVAHGGEVGPGDPKCLPNAYKCLSATVLCNMRVCPK